MRTGHQASGTMAARSLLLSCLALLVFVRLQLLCNSEVYTCSNLNTLSLHQRIIYGPKSSVDRHFGSSSPSRVRIRSTRNYESLSRFFVGLLLLCGDISTQPGPSRSISAHSSFTCMVSNARSLKSFKKTQDSIEYNLHRFQNLVYLEDADVVCVNETWLNATIDNSEILSNGYTIYRKDRVDKHAGGVLIAVKNGVFKSIQKFPLQAELQDLEIVCSVLTTATDLKLLFCSCYRPPDAEESWAILFDKFLNSVCSKFDNVLLCGDFNLGSIPWEAPDCATGKNEQLFVDALNDYSLIQLNRKFTRGERILDLVITSAPEHTTVSDVLSVEQSGLFTDHCTILFQYNTFLKAPAKSDRSVFDYEKADFDGLREAISAINLSSYINNEDINTNWQQWKDAFLAAVSDFIPSKTLKGRNPVPWINGNVLNLIKKKNSVRQRLRKSPTNYLKEKFRALRSKIKQMLRECREDFFSSLESKSATNPKRFWSILKYKSKSKTLPNFVTAPSGSNTIADPGLQPSSRTTAEYPRGIANLFNSYFASIFTHKENQPDDSPVSPQSRTLSEICLTISEVQLILKSLDVTKATGPDGISARLLRETATEIAPSLCKLFNKSLSSGTVPQEWKEANVVPVFKKGEAEKVENYRPISLLPLISKVLERCVLNSFKDYLLEVIKACQHGFISGKSCTTNLLEVLDHIGSLLDNGKQIDVVYMDMSKAFDKVCHQRLLHKLSQFGFSGSLLQWFQSYLSNRYQRVTVLGAASDPLQVSSGVPQGSILGPALFLIYVNDLPDAVKTSHLAMFADDTKLYQVIKDPADVDALQSDLERLDAWSNESGLLFNESKCKHQTITRKIKPIKSSYNVKGKLLETVTTERDLGVIVSSNITWNQQVLEQTSRANRLLGYVKRNTKFIKSIHIRKTVYLTLVRPLFGYATQIWAPQSIDLITRVERIQRRATKYILKLPFRCKESYTDRLRALHLIPVNYWHEYLDMVFFFKITHGLTSLSPSALPAPRVTRLTRSSSSNITKYNVRKCKTSTYQNSFVVRSTRIWNTLADELNLNMDNLSSFKSVMHNYYFCALNNYDCNNPRTFKSICLKCNVARNLARPVTCCQ